MPSRVVWLAAAANGPLRLSLDHRCTDPSRPSLGQTACFRLNELCEASLHDASSASGSATAMEVPAGRIVALLHVEADFVYTSLHMLSPEQQLQHDFFQRLSQQPLEGKLVFWKVLRCVRIAPVPVVDVQAWAQVATARFWLRDTAVAKMHRDLIQSKADLSWVPDHFASEMSQGLSVPAPFAKFIVSGD
eukprot:5259946-Lingulodinium_polyedra.AAC.1